MLLRLLIILSLLLGGCSLTRPISALDTTTPGIIKYQGPENENAELIKSDGTVVKFNRKGEPWLDKAVGIKTLLNTGGDND